ATSDSLRAELAQRVSRLSDETHTIGKEWGRLPMLEKQLYTETGSREISFAEMAGQLERLKQLLTAELGELKGDLHKVRLSGAASDSLRAEVAQRVSRFEETHEAERSARETLTAKVDNHIERLDENVRTQDELRRNVQELRAIGVASNALRAELAQRV